MKSDNLNIGDNIMKEQLFFIAVEDDVPLVLHRNMVLLYSRMESAGQAAGRFGKLYNDSKIRSVEIRDKQNFFVEMQVNGVKSFLLDGDGEIRNCMNYCNVNPAKVPGALSEKFKLAQPDRIVAPAPVSLKYADVSEAIAILPAIHRKRLTTAYVCGFIAIVISVILGFFNDVINEDIRFLYFVFVAVSLYGIDMALTVAGKVKEKNPTVRVVAKLSIVLYPVAIVLFMLLLGIR